MDGQYVFTPASILDLLSQIKELEDYDLSVYETLDGEIQIQIGDSFYQITDQNNATIIETDDDVVDIIEETNEETYEDIVEDDNASMISNETIEGGLVKEALKTLLIGGVVRLAKNYLKN